MKNREAAVDHWEGILETEGVPTLATKRQVADVLGVTTRTVERWHACGALDAMKLMGAVRIPRRAVARFLAERYSGACR